jgi:TATA-box binding protein (TBP) (component of TFIID and TFIIIB)
MTTQSVIKKAPFDDLKVSTNTFLALTNIVFNDFDVLASVLPITEYIIVAKKRGRKKKIPESNPNSVIAPWSIITINTGKNCIGVNLKKVKNTKKVAKTTKNWFRNSITIVMTTDIFSESGEPKKINFKICKNGKLQMTGCKSIESAETCVKTLWGFIKETNVYTFSNTNHDNQFRCSFIPCMHNITFNLGVNINRELIDWFYKIFYGLAEQEMITGILDPFIDSDSISKILDQVIKRSMNTREMVSILDVIKDLTGISLPQSTISEIDKVIREKSIFSILETSVGYTGVNIKFQLKDDISSLPIRTRVYADDDWDDDIVYIPRNRLPTIIKKKEKDRYNTFLLFYSGKVILSGMCDTYQRDVYNQFMEIMTKYSEYFIETLRE